jgi:hypothetical protein
MSGYVDYSVHYICIPFCYVLISHTCTIVKQVEIFSVVNIQIKFKADLVKPPPPLSTVAQELNNN